VPFMPAFDGMLHLACSLLPHYWRLNLQCFVLINVHHVLVVRPLSRADCRLLLHEQHKELQSVIVAAAIVKHSGICKSYLCTCKPCAGQVVNVI
jgi:hypothetical protein